MGEAVNSRSEKATTSKKNGRNETSGEDEGSHDDCPEMKKVHTRCSPSYFTNVMEELKPIIGERQKSRILNTPFASWMDMPALAFSPGRLGYFLRRFDGRSSSFLLPRGIAIPFRSPDFSVVLGLKHRGPHVDFNRTKHSVFLSSRFGGRLSDAHRAGVREKLLVLAGSDDGDEVDDFVRLFILLAFNCIVFPIHKRWTPGFIFPYLDDLATFFDHAWGNAAFRFLRRALRDFGNKFYMDGCLIGLMALVYETFPSLGVRCSSNVYPRMFRWARSNFPTSHAKLESLFECMDSTCVKHIQPCNDDEEALLLECVSNTKEETSNVGRLGKKAGRSKIERCPKSESQNPRTEPKKKKPAAARRGNVAKHAGKLDKSRGKDETEDIISRDVDVVMLDDSDEEDTRNIRLRTASNRGHDIAASKVTDNFGSIGDRVKKRKSSVLVNSPPTCRIEAEKPATSREPFIDIDGDSGAETTTEEDDVDDVFKGRVDFIGHENASDEDIELVMKFLALEEPEAIIWDDGCKNLRGRELRTLLFRDAVGSEIIDVYTRIMQKQSLKNGSEIFCVDTSVQANVLSLLEKYHGKKRTVPECERGGFLSKLSSSTRHLLTELKEDTFERCRYVVFPLNHRWHWFLLVFDARRGVFNLWNSVHDARSTATAKAYVKFLCDYTRRFSGFEVACAAAGVVRASCRQQGPGLDCGVYACMWLHCLAYDTEEVWEYAEKVDVEAYRVRIAATILRDRPFE